MRVFVTGASGWVGSTLVPELLDAGHEVLGLARSAESEERLRDQGVTPVRGDLDDPAGLARIAADADGVVHLAFNHDFSNFEGALRTDAAAVEAIGEALVGTGKPLVVTGGTPAVPGRVSTEEDWSPEGGPASSRDDNLRAVLAFADRGVRSMVVRLPRSVHGEGDAGFVSMLVGVAREHGVAGYVGDGSARWPAVHVSDAAAVYRLGLESAPAGSVLDAVGDEGVATRDIAAAIGERLGLEAGPLPAEAFGFLGGLLATDQPSSGARTRELLDWAPSGPGLLADIAAHYPAQG